MIAQTRLKLNYMVQSAKREFVVCGSTEITIREFWAFLQLSKTVTIRYLHTVTISLEVKCTEPLYTPCSKKTCDHVFDDKLN